MQDLAQHISVLKQHGYQQDEATILLMRLQLIKIINAEIKRQKWTQREAAQVLRVAQPRIAELSVLATEKFSIESLIKLLQRLGLKASLMVRPGKHYVRPARIMKALSAKVKSNPKQKGRSNNSKKPLKKIIKTTI